LSARDPRATGNGSIAASSVIPALRTRRRSFSTASESRLVRARASSTAGDGKRAGGIRRERAARLTCCSSGRRGEDNTSSPLPCL
jgi:hypothetical protein